MRLNTFDEVANWFDKTVPIRGQRAAQVIRPIGARNRAWERIEKADENCYFLTDGWGSWTVRNMTLAERNARTSYYTAMAPILWERREDGEYVRIRNCPTNSSSPSRYNFTRWNLPEGLTFSWGDKERKSGKHYITAKGVDGHEKFFLPKFSARQSAVGNDVEYDTGQMLWFKRVGNGVWQRVGEIMGEPVKRLNKAVTQEYKQAINEFYSFMGATIPALGFMNSDARTVYWQMLNSNPTEHYYWGRKLTQLDKPELVREILRTEDHSLRVALAVMVAHELGVYAQSGTYLQQPDGSSKWVSHEYVRLPEDAEQAKAMRRTYMGIIRKAGDMFETVYK